MQVTESVSEAVGMSLGVRKCAVAHMRAGRVRRGGDVDTLQNRRDHGGRLLQVPRHRAGIWEEKCGDKEKGVRRIPATCQENLAEV